MISIQTDKKKPDRVFGRPVLYDFNNMKNGDSFTLKFPNKAEARKKRDSVIACAYERGFKISTRIIPKPNGRFNLSVWMEGKKK